MKKLFSILLLSTFTFLASLVVEHDASISKKMLSNDLCGGAAEVQREGEIIKTSINYRGKPVYTIKTNDGCYADFELPRAQAVTFSVGDTVNFVGRTLGGFGQIISIEKTQRTCQELLFHDDSFTYDGRNKYTWNRGELTADVSYVRLFRKHHKKANTTFTSWNVCYNTAMQVVGMEYLGR